MMLQDSAEDKCYVKLDVTISFESFLLGVGVCFFFVLFIFTKIYVPRCTIFVIFKMSLNCLSFLSQTLRSFLYQDGASRVRATNVLFYSLFSEED